MKKLLTFLMMSILAIGVGWAGTVTFSYTGSGQAVQSSNGITITISQGTSSTDPATNTYSGAHFRIYKDNDIEIDAGSYTIESVAFTCVSGYASYWSSDNVTNGSISVSGTTVTVSDVNSSSTTIHHSGSATRITQAVVTYTSGGTSSVATPTITLDPASGPYYEGSTVTATIACSTTDATLQYSYDGTTWTDYTAPLSITETKTIHAKASLNGQEATAEKTVTFVAAPNSVANIEAYNDLADNSEFTFAGDVVVTYVNSTDTRYVWIKDGTGSALLYNSGLNPSQGDVIKGGWTGKKTNYYGLYEITNVSNATIQGSQTVTPAELTISQVKTENQATYGYLRGVVITAKNNRNFTISDGTNSVAGYNTYNSDASINVPDANNGKTYDILGIVNVYNDVQFTPVAFTEVESTLPQYYLYGTFNNWVIGDDDYKFTIDGNNTYSLNNVELPANVRFKIAKVVGTTNTEYGASNNGSDYGINSGWHNNLPMDGDDAYTIAPSGKTNFSLNTSTMTFDVERPQLFLKGSYDNYSTATEMTPITTGGWTVTKELAVGDQIGFTDGWGVWHGGDGAWILEEYLDQELNMSNSGDFVIRVAGNYTLTVNSDMSKLIASVVVSSEGDVYKLVTTADELVSGEKYLIVGSTAAAPYSAILGPWPTSGNYATAVKDNFTYNEDDNTITLGDGCTATPLTLGGSAGAWTFNNGSGFLAYTSTSTSSNNNLWVVSSASDNGATWTIDASKLPSSTTLIVNVYNTDRKLNYNNDRFAGYVNTQSAVALFKKVSSVTPSNKVATPVINPGSADSSNPYTVYGGKQEITISCATDGATIYYTIDGSDPATSTTRETYGTAPFDLTSAGGTKTVKAIAVKTDSDLENSEIATAYYLFTNPVAPTFTPASGTVHSEAFDVTISSEYDDAEIYYLLDPTGETAPTANQIYNDGNGNLFESPVNVSGEGAHTIYAIVVRNGIKSTVAKATYRITSGGTTGDGEYVKVTSTADLEDGEYLIVYEGDDDHDPVAFNGALETLDAEGNNISVVINNNTIASSDAVDAAVFTINVSDGTIKNKDDVYIGASSNANTITTSTEPLSNTISIEDGNAVILGAGGAYLRYNYASNQTRFRYYKSSSYSSQQPIALYKKSAPVVVEPVTLDGVTFTEGTNGRHWATWYGDKNLAFPDDVDVTVYVVTGIDGDAVVVETVGYIPANTGVLLYSETAAESVSAMPYSGEAGTIPTNLLVGSLEEQAVSDAYLLYDNQFILAQNGTQVGAHRCYLPITSASQGAPVLRIGTPGTVTGVEDLIIDGNNDVMYYDLSGRCIGKSLNGKRGIFITSDGKKVVK